MLSKVVVAGELLILGQLVVNLHSDLIASFVAHGHSLQQRAAYVWGGNILFKQVDSRWIKTLGWNLLIRENSGPIHGARGGCGRERYAKATSIVQSCRNKV